MGTVDNSFVFHGLITHHLNHGKKMFSAFVDFTKALDYVVRDNLWFKLVKLGLRRNILNIIKSMYESVKSRVKLRGKNENEYFYSLGLRQGECLSPLLFTLFLNDIEEKFSCSGVEGLDLDSFKIFMLLYADDIVVFANNEEQLQCGLDVLSQYCARWKLEVNVSKTKNLIVRKGGILPRNLAFTYDGEPLEIVKRRFILGNTKCISWTSTKDSF